MVIAEHATGLIDNGQEVPGSRTGGDILRDLRRPFHPELIRSRKIGGRQVQYVPISAVIERLNKSCGLWSFRLVDHDMTSMRLNRWNEATRKSEPRDVTVFVVVGELEIPQLGRRQAMGVQALDDGSGEDLLKGASSDALKKAAGLFGLWSPE